MVGKGISVSSLFMHADAVDMLLMAVGSVGAMGDGLTMPVMNIVNSHLMNNMGSVYTVTPEKFTERINKNAVLLLYLACASFVASFLGGYCWTRTGERQSARMRARYLKAVLRQDVGYFDLHATTTSEVITSVSNDSLIVQDALSEKVPNFVKQITLFIGSYVSAFFLLWRLAIVGFPFIVLLIIPSFTYGRVLMNLTRKTREEYNKAGTILEQAISSVRIVYSFVGETKMGSQFSKALEGSVNLGLRLGLAKGLAVGSHAVSFAIYAFMTFYGSRMVMYHGAKGGTVFVVSLAIIVGGSALGHELSNLKYLAEACAAAERIMEMIHRVPAIDSEDLKGEILSNVSGKIEFRNVKFAYPSRPETLVFRSFSLKVPGGRTVALVGASGSGKSTVVSLLQRYYDPLGGEILLDGVGIQRLQLKWLRSQMGLVSQEPSLFATSIKENILFGKEDASMDEVMEAAKASNAHDFVSQLPQGYDTRVGEQGVQISGGQKQRIAIARAIIKAPKILLLDEATSALDAESERAVQDALDQATVGRTSIVIAHRLSTIRNADIIAVVQDGQVMETGSHNELTQSEDGLYTSLVRLQQIEQDGIDDDPTSSSFPPNSILKTDTNNNSSSRRRFPPAPQSTVEGEDSSSGHPKESKPPRPSFWRLIALNLPEWKQASIAFMSAILQGAVQPIFAFTMGGMISVYFLPTHEEMKAQTRFYCLCLVALMVFVFVNNCILHYTFAYIGEYLTRRIREQLMSKILTFEIGWFDQDKNSSGAVCARLAKDAYAVRNLVGDRLSLLVQTISTIVVAWTMGLVISWRLALLMIAVQPLVIGSYYTRRVILKVMTEKALRAQEMSSNLASEAVANLRTITAFSSQQRFLKMLEKAQEGPRIEAIRQSWYAGLGLGISQSITCLLWALDYWYGSKLVVRGYITAKDMFQTFMILFSTGRVIANAGSMVSDLAKVSEMIDSVFSVLDRSSKINPNEPEGFKPETISGNVEFRRVDFAYPERPEAMIFRDFTIKIEAGKSTALVGHSGSGKSTVIALIERFYDPIHGVVKIDGRDIKSYNLRSLREHIALVSQEPALFTTTIRENIAYGATKEVTEAEIVAAAVAANVHDFVSSLNDGYETSCGDRGVQLSGGQKQRIAIARAILKNSGLLLLDEATSALDGHSEKLVQEALERVMEGRTSVVVAHRLSSIQKCHEILVMDKGKVVEKGSHGALMAKGASGAYYSLVSLQRTEMG